MASAFAIPYNSDFPDDKSIFSCVWLQVSTQSFQNITTPPEVDILVRLRPAKSASDHTATFSGNLW